MAADLRVLTPPSDLAVSLPEAKTHLRISAADTAEDALLSRMIRAAAAEASAECGLGFGSATYVLTLDGFGTDADRLLGEPIRLPVRPVLSVSSVEYFDADGVSTVMPTADYWVGLRKGAIVPAAGHWPLTQARRPESLSVTFVAGEAVATIPHQAWQAILLILADRYEHRGDGADRRPVPESAVRLLRQIHLGDWV